MHNYHPSLAEVEREARANGFVPSEAELSRRFDREVLPHVLKKYGTEDYPAIRTAFNDFKDILHREGELHDLQAYNYCYIGRYAARCMQ